ncbi:hypothetical protein C7S16_0981 [Burkholderia thailandensis]|uniref:Uncharacterized protein n=1 Tax=Burkholderia thailandensis TaxID=57975 RepID=A0AAW9D4J9_BURTH|nr:hypothetical protein [Burkholderia thailandensis]MDW9256829.1 hypothetical protein [Burkholderia thailandensis]
MGVFRRVHGYGLSRNGRGFATRRRMRRETKKGRNRLPEPLPFMSGGVCRP